MGGCLSAPDAPTQPAPSTAPPPVPDQLVKVQQPVAPLPAHATAPVEPANADANGSDAQGAAVKTNEAAAAATVASPDDVQLDASNKLLITSADTTDDKRTAMATFHTEQHQGLYQLQPELSVLADLHLDTVLGAGGFASVMRGFWRGSTEVAVKIITTTPDSATKEGEQPQLPVRALAEALLARDLAHPNIIKTFDVRCCRVSPAFMEALYSQQPKHFTSTHSYLTPVAGESPAAEAARRAKHQAEVAATSASFSKYTGITPLWTQIQGSTDEEHVTEEECVTLDGFGAAKGSGGSPGMSWVEVLARTAARPGDFMTVIIMQLANFGTLWTAIKSQVFVRKPTALASDKRRRLRALLRTLREIAMALEHLHACRVVHGDLKPANVLLHDSRADSRGFTALLTDFGLAHLVLGNKHYSKNASGTTNYMAPELFMDGEVARSTDVYAFGICLWEAVHGCAAYNDEEQKQVLLSVMHGARPIWRAPQEAQLPELQAIYRRCVDATPENRPTSTELVAELGRLEDAARAESQKESMESKKPSMAQQAEPGV